MASLRLRIEALEEQRLSVENTMIEVQNRSKSVMHSSNILHASMSEYECDDTAYKRLQRENDTIVHQIEVKEAELKSLNTKSS